MPSIRYVIIHPTTLEQYRHGPHEVTFDSMSEGEELLTLLHTEFGEQYADFIVMNNLDVLTLLEEHITEARMERYFPAHRDILLPFSQRWSTMGSTN